MDPGGLQAVGKGRDNFFYSTSFFRIADVVLIKGQKRISYQEHLVAVHKFTGF